MSAAQRICALALVALAQACRSEEALVGPGNPKIVGLAIQPNPISLGSGSDIRIKVIAADSNGDPVEYDKRQLGFISSDSAVAIPRVGSCVDGDCGLDHPDELVAGRPGMATITALLTTTEGPLTATAPVTVTDTDLRVATVAVTPGQLSNPDLIKANLRIMPARRAHR